VDPRLERAPSLERPSGSATLIVNPNAGRGRVGRALPAVEEALRCHGFDYRLDLTTGTGDATRLARDALERGERFLVAVGGDGTVNEVVNGMLEGDRQVAPDAVLGVLAANSGCDVVRTFGLSQDPATAVERFSTGRVYAIDVGKATVATGSGAASRYFLGVAEAGLGGAAVARRARVPRAFGRSRYFLGYWAALATYRRPAIRLRGDRREFEGRATNVVVANLQFTGNGMLISPRSWPEDGYLDLQVYVGPKSESFTLLPKMFQGEHLPRPSILEYRSKAVRIEADRPLYVQTDGEPLGRTPATFEALQQTLRFLI